MHLWNPLSMKTTCNKEGCLMENYFINMNTRVLGEPILLLLLLSHQFEK